MRPIQLTATVVSAYVSNNTVPSAEIPVLFCPDAGHERRAGRAVPLKPAVPINHSVTPEYIVCLEDGKKFKSLKRHLRSQFLPKNAECSSSQ
jgi:predicted transcriptional regulator